MSRYQESAVAVRVVICDVDDVESVFEFEAEGEREVALKGRCYATILRLLCFLSIAAPSIAVAEVAHLRDR